MKDENKLTAEKVGEVILFKQEYTKEMTVEEAVQDLKKLEKQLAQMHKTEQTIQSDIDNNTLQAELEKVQTHISRMEEVVNKLKEYTKDHLDEVKKKYKLAVKTKLAEKGYGRMKGDEKIATKNQVLGIVCGEMNVDRAEVWVQEFSNELNK